MLIDLDGIEVSFEEVRAMARHNYYDPAICPPNPQNDDDMEIVDDDLPLVAEGSNLSLKFQSRLNQSFKSDFKGFLLKLFR